jgi:hypothetical protein
MPRIKTHGDAEEAIFNHLRDRMGYGYDDLKFVWMMGNEPNATYWFRTKEGGSRSLWRVGPRGAVNRFWTLQAWQWEALD